MFGLVVRAALVAAALFVLVACAGENRGPSIQTPAAVTSVPLPLALAPTDVSPATAGAPTRGLARLAPAQSGPVTIYLPRLFEDGTLGLRAVTRPQTILDDPARDGLEALLRGPTGDERADDFEYALDPHTRLLGLAVRDMTATVDFDSGIDRVYGRPFSELVYWSIVYTATEAADVQRVALSEQGEPLREIGYPPIPVLFFATRADAPDWVRPR